MFIANNKGVGISIGFPDVCATPAGPVPFLNTSPNAMKFPFSRNTYYSFMPALNIASIALITLGDQPGVLHWSFMGPDLYVIGNPIVLVNFLPSTHLLIWRVGNRFNNPVGTQAVPSATNVFICYNANGGEGSRGAEPMRASDVERLDASLDRGGSSPPVARGWLGRGVGYLRVSRLSLDVPSRVHTALQALEAEGLETLVLDLRGNPGGELTAFLELAGDFLEPGCVLARAIDADGDETVYRATHESPCRVPLWIFVDRATASAAELLAGCLQWHGRAIVAGGPTFGKGTALKLVPDRATGEPVLATFADVRLPDGRPIHGIGVQPDIELQEDFP